MSWKFLQGHLVLGFHLATRAHTERSSRALVVTEDWDVQIYAALCLINPGAVHLNVSAMSISNMQVSEYPAEQHPKED